jgi:ketosteroid isomerase-like protein
LTSGSATFLGRASGLNVEAKAAQLWQLRDGQVTSFRFYQSKEDALAALEAEGGDPAQG